MTPATESPGESNVLVEISRTLDTLCPNGDVVELRAFVTDQRGYKKTYAGWFDDREALAKEAVELEGMKGEIYFTLNPTEPSLLGRAYNEVVPADPRSMPQTTDTDIRRRKWILVDCDPVRPSKISATKEEKNASLERMTDVEFYLKEMGFPVLVLADSGNGAHILVPVDLPNDEESLELVRGFLEALDFLFSDERVSIDTGNFNAARITKCYGTTARKGANEAKLGRNHRQSRLLHVPQSIWPAERSALEDVAAKRPDVEQPKGDPRRNRHQTEFDLATWIVEHDVPVKREGPWKDGGYRRVLEECIWLGHQDNSAYIVQGKEGWISAGCSHNSCRTGKNRWHEVREHYEPGWKTKKSAGASDSSYSENSENGFLGYDFEKPPIPLAPEMDLPEFPLDALPKVYRKTAEAACETYQVPAMLAGSLTLGVIAAAVGGRAEVVPRDGWEEPLVVWPLPLLESGETKTATFKFYQQPISDWVEEMSDDYRKQLWRYESKLAAIDKLIEAKQKEAAKAESLIILNQSDGLFQEKAELKPPRSPEFIMSDTTGEGASRTAKHTGGHIALLSDEGETLKIIAGRYAKDGQADVEFWLKAHAGSPYRVRRSTREGFDLSRVTAAFVASVQPDVILQLRGVAQLKGLGFFARLLYGLPKSSIGKRKARRDAIPADVKAAYERAVRNLFPADFADYNSNDELRVEFSGPADRALEKLQEEIEPQLVGDLDQLRDWASKFPGAVARIAGLLHVADRGFAGKVSKETYEAAEKIGRCYLAHAQAVFFRLGQDPRIEAARHVLSKLAAGEKISKRDLFQKVKGHHLTQTTEQLDAALKVLADHGWVREVPQEREGPGRKPSPLLEINPLTPESGSQNSHNSSSASAKADKNVDDDEEMPKSGDEEDWAETASGHQQFAYRIFVNEFGGKAHPDEWEEHAVTHGMTERTFRVARTSLEHSGKVLFHIADRHENSFYHLPDVCPHPEEDRVLGNNGYEACEKCGRYV